MKLAKNDKEAWDLQTIPEDPSGWVQWKGTDVCMDLHCKCGEMSHIDGEFAYVVQCPHCKTKYFCNGHIELIEIENTEKSVILGG